MAILKAFGVFFVQFLIATWLANYFPWITDEFMIKPRVAGRQGLGFFSALPLIGGFGIPGLAPAAPAPAAPVAPVGSGPTPSIEDVVGYDS